MSTLPPGWHECTLGSISSDISYGYTAKSNSTIGDARMLRITDIQENKVNWSTVPFCKISESEKNKYLLRKWDLVFARTGATVGKSFLIREDAPNSVFASYLIRVRLIENEMARYLSRFFDSHAYWSQITEFSAGIGQSNVNGSKLKSLRVPLAPLSEQKRIADKLDTVLARVGACRERLNRFPLILKRFRQSALAVAVSGKLTVEWRTRNGYSMDEWESRDVSSVCSDIVDCPHSTPKWAESGVYCVRTTEFNPGYLDLKQAKFVSEDTYHERTKRLVPKSGDILYSREGTVGVACQIPENVRLCLGQRILLLRPSDEILSTYLMYVLNSPATLSKVSQLVMGSTAPRLNIPQIKSFSVPLPSMSEQHEIVRRVEILFAFADRLETRLTTANDIAARLTPALLAKAFRGELVPQDPNDEPAAELLKRLAASREPSPKSKRSSKQA